MKPDPLQAFGTRITNERKKRSLSQIQLSQLCNLDQPRLSRLEKGDIPASVTVIERLAEAFDIDPVELIASTDREEYYYVTKWGRESFAELRAREARQVHDINAATLFILEATYRRVYDMFEAVYGGPWAAPPISGDETYLHLRTSCENMLKELDPDWVPGLTEQVYFPDHIECHGEFDWPLEEWLSGERGYVKQSLLTLSKLVAERCASVSPKVRQTLIEHFGLPTLDHMNRKVEEQRIRLNRAFSRNLASAPPTAR